jgi:hypothetical protein
MPFNQSKERNLPCILFLPKLRTHIPTLVVMQGRACAETRQALFI